MPEFKKGDIVQLKSGGPEMTVMHTGANGIYCVWFAGKKLEEKTFARETLIQVTVFDAEPGVKQDRKKLRETL